MPKTPDLRFPFRPAQGRGWLCLLLIISFLFNPFLAVSSSSFGTIVSHLPSFRATVASSELLKFNPQQKIVEQPAPELVLLGQPGLPLMSQGAAAPLLLSEEISVPSYSPVGNVWVRPPPVA